MFSLLCPLLFSVFIVFYTFLNLSKAPIIAAFLKHVSRLQLVLYCRSSTCFLVYGVILPRGHGQVTLTSYHTLKPAVGKRRAKSHVTHGQIQRRGQLRSDWPHSCLV